MEVPGLPLDHAPRRLATPTPATGHAQFVTTRLTTGRAHLWPKATPRSSTCQLATPLGPCPLACPDPRVSTPDSPEGPPLAQHPQVSTQQPAPRVQAPQSPAGGEGGGQRPAGRGEPAGVQPVGSDPRSELGRAGCWVPPPQCSLPWAREDCRWNRGPLHAARSLPEPQGWHPRVEGTHVPTGTHTPPPVPRSLSLKRHARNPASAERAPRGVSVCFARGWPGSIPGTPEDSLNLPGAVFERRTRRNP